MRSSDAGGRFPGIRDRQTYRLALGCPGIFKLAELERTEAWRMLDATAASLYEVIRYLRGH